MDSKTFFPDFSKVGTLVVFVAFILSYMGVEASATHVNEMSNPGRDYPLAMLLLMVAAICLSSVGGLSIAMVIPGNEINLSAGVMQTFTVLMSHVAPEIEWTVRVISHCCCWVFWRKSLPGLLVLLAGCMSQRRKTCCQQHSLK
ncbi:amino acid permease [Escherichia coli]|nr:amino acid permease [Escherichia coli]